MIVIVAGGRYYDNRDALWAVLDKLLAERGIKQIVQGGATGADALGKAWAFSRGIPYHTEPADWNKHQSAAGPIRNQKMIDGWNPDALVVCPGNRGTADMLRKAAMAGIEIIKVAQ